VETKAPPHLEKEAIMVRSALTVLALAILPGFAAAQQPAQAASQTHVVVAGETLWALAQRYYQDPFLWPRIFEANRGQIDDPDLIEPDQQIVIPGIAADESEMAAGEPAIVGEVAVSAAGPQAPSEPPGGDAAEEELTERERRSVFFRDPVTSTGLLGLTEADYLLVSCASVWSAEWLGPENIVDIESDGTIESFVTEGELRIALPYTRVRLDLDDGVRVALGDALQIYRPLRTVEGLGSIMRPSGVLSVTRVDDGVVEGVVLQLFERMQPGDLVRPASTFDLEAGQYPDVVTNRTGATVLEFGGSHALYNLGDVAILDRGGEHGVDIGDEYVAFQGDGSTEEVVGRLRVVATESQTASARIVSVEGPVFQTGIAVHLDRKMR
jgi:LysM repeat protein